MVVMGGEAVERRGEATVGLESSFDRVRSLRLLLEASTDPGSSAGVASRTASDSMRGRGGKPAVS